jgi:hypothetical protein
MKQQLTLLNQQLTVFHEKACRMLTYFKQQYDYVNYFTVKHFTVFIIVILRIENLIPRAIAAIVQYYCSSGDELYICTRLEKHANGEHTSIHYLDSQIDSRRISISLLPLLVFILSTIFSRPSIKACRSIKKVFT